MSSPLQKTSIKETDKDFHDFDITFGPATQRHDLVISANTGTGELVRRLIDGDGRIIEGAKPETLIGEIRITPLAPKSEEPQATSTVSTPVEETVDKTKGKAHNPATKAENAGKPPEEIETSTKK